MENFVITGKARQVFRIIALKAIREKELDEAMKKLRKEVDNADNRDH